MNKKTRTTIAAYGALALAALGVFIDLLRAESLIRALWEDHVPSFPAEIVIKPVEINSLSAYACATKLSPTMLRAARIDAQIVPNSCQSQMDDILSVLESNSPSDVLSRVNYTLLINGMDTDIKRLTLFSGEDQHRFEAVLSGTAIAFCNVVERTDRQIEKTQPLHAVEVILEHNGSPIYLDLTETTAASRQILADPECSGVFTYPH